MKSSRKFSSVNPYLCTIILLGFSLYWVRYPFYSNFISSSFWIYQLLCIVLPCLFYYFQNFLHCCFIMQFATSFSQNVVENSLLLCLFGKYSPFWGLTIMVLGTFGMSILRRDFLFDSIEHNFFVISQCSFWSFQIENSSYFLGRFFFEGRHYRREGDWERICFCLPAHQLTALRQRIPDHVDI